MLFWDKLAFIALDNICKALVALFHDKAREVIFIFDKIIDLDDHRVIESSKAGKFSFCCTLYLTCVELSVNLILQSFGSVCLSIYFRLDFEDNGLAALLDYLNRIIIVVSSA